MDKQYVIPTSKTSEENRNLTTAHRPPDQWLLKHKLQCIRRTNVKMVLQAGTLHCEETLSSPGHHASPGPRMEIFDQIIRPSNRLQYTHFLRFMDRDMYTFRVCLYLSKKGLEGLTHARICPEVYVHFSPPSPNGPEEVPSNDCHLNSPAAIQRRF